MTRLFLLAFALAALLVCPAFAADTIIAPTTDHKGCKIWKLCDDQAAGTVCVTGALNNIVRATNEYSFSAWADESDSDEAWTIKIYDKAPGSGYDGTDRTLLNTSDMTPTAMKFSWDGLSGDLHAVLGGTLTNGVTLTIKGCPLSNK